MENALKYAVSCVLVGLFYVLIWYGKLKEATKKVYYDVSGIQYRTMPDKFYSYHVRTNNK